MLNECELWFNRKTTSRKQLQSFAGILHHLSKCIKPALRFTNRVLQAMRLTPFKGQHKFDKNLLLDLMWFIKFAKLYNGIQLLPTAPRLEWVIECDASLSGAGAFAPSNYYGIVYDQDLLAHNLHITQLEALNLVPALKMLILEKTRDFTIIVNTDNAASQQVLEAGRGRDPILCACPRQIWLL